MFGSLLVSLVLVTGVALPASGPLDLDPAFGDGGSVAMSRSVRAIEARGDNTVVAGATGLLGGSGEYGVFMALVDPSGAGVRSIFGQVPAFGAKPIVTDVMTTPDRNFVLGWQLDADLEVSYGFVAAFPAELDGYTSWGSDAFFLGEWEVAEPPWTGLERLDEVPFTEVTAGAVDRRGRVLVAGRIDDHAAVIRLTAAGIDPTFGVDGIARYAIGSASTPTDLEVGRGSLLVGNTTLATGQQGYALRLTSEGLKDNAWGDYGLQLIDQPGSSVHAVAYAGRGRWLVGYQNSVGTQAGVEKRDAAGDLVDAFGTSGRAVVACERPASGRSVDGLTIWWTDTGIRRITMTLSCANVAGTQRLAAMWRRDGSPIRTLQPGGVGPLPWTDLTLDVSTADSGKVMALTSGRLYRLN